MKNYNELLGRKYKTSLLNVYPLVLFIRDIKPLEKSFNIHFSDPILVSYYDKKLPSKTFYRYIEILKKIEILKCTFNQFHFDLEDKKKNYCRRYVLNTAAISEYLKTMDLLLSDPVNSNCSSYNYPSPDTTTTSYNNMLCVTFEEKRVEIVNRLNSRTFVSQNCGLVTWYNKRRATSRFCSLPTKEKEHKDIPLIYREDYLDNFFGKDNWEEYDVPSSVPQVFHLLNKGFWLGKRVYNMTSDPAKFKEYAMRLMFNKSNVQIARAILLLEDNKLHTLNLERHDKFYAKQTDPALVEIAGNMKQELENIIGSTKMGGEVFQHESNIYLLVGEELMNRGIDFLQCYDGFYFRKGERPADMAEIVKSKAEEYYRVYYSKNN